MGEYASAGTAVAPPAAASAYQGETTSRASAYAGKTVAVIVRTSRSLAAEYCAAVVPSHHTGARKYATREASPYGTPRRAASPVWAIARESCAISFSSEKIVGTGRFDACHAYSAASAK